MPLLFDVGDVSTDGERTIRWTIPRYMEMPREVGTGLWSPYFTFRGGEKCELHAYPNGCKNDGTEGWMGMECCIPSLPPHSTVKCCLVDSQGREVLRIGKEDDESFYAQCKWILRTELESRSSELMPGGQLRTVWRIVLPGERGHNAEEEDNTGDEVDVRNRAEISNSGNHANSNEGAGGDGTMIMESNINMSRQQGLCNLSQCLEGLYIDSKHTDFIIRVRGRDFRVHRVLLQARVPAFDAMLTHDMAENKEGVVKMEDCDPEVFNNFLLFVYSGRVENLDPDNMCGLYILGDKYDLQDLKNTCLNFMKTSLSVQTICDVIRLATTHREAELLKLATDFFVKNAKDILVTVKWQQFMVENPTESNELFLKTLNFCQTKTDNK